jgi:hypothetical protein
VLRCEESRWLTRYRIQNPLTGLTKAELLRNVETYAQKHELSNIVELLKKGALVAQNPAHPEAIGELTTQELDSLQAEKTHRWSHPKTLYLMVVFNSIGAAIQGMDFSLRLYASTDSIQRLGSDWLQWCQSFVPPRVRHCRHRRSLRKHGQLREKLVDCWCNQCCTIHGSLCYVSMLLVVLTKH